MGFARMSNHIGALAMVAMVGGLGFTSLDSRAIELLEDRPPAKRKRKAATYSSASRVRGRLPHIGAKERVRHAGKPDGPMHGLPLLFRQGASA